MKTLTRIFDDASTYARQQFSLNELKMMLDVMNGTIVTPMSAGRCLAANIEDSFRLYPGLFEEKWAIKDREEFERKINSLPPVFAVMLEIWAADFWEIDPLPDLDDYVSGKIKATFAVAAALRCIGAAISLMEKSKQACKSKTVALARAEAEKARDILEEACR